MGALGEVVVRPGLLVWGSSVTPLRVSLARRSSSSGRNSPLERCDPLRLVQRGAVLGHGSFLKRVSLRDPLHKVAATCGGFARRLTHPLWRVQLERCRAQSSVPSRVGGRLSV